MDLNHCLWKSFFFYLNYFDLGNLKYNLVQDIQMDKYTQGHIKLKLICNLFKVSIEGSLNTLDISQIPPFCVLALFLLVLPHLRVLTAKTYYDLKWKIQNNAFSLYM